MKAKLMILAVLVACLTITGCGDKEVTSNGKDPTISNQQTSEELAMTLEDFYKPNAVREDLSDVFVPKKDGAPVVNVNSIREFLASIQAIENTMYPYDRQELKGALTIHIIAGQYKIQMVAKTYGNPKLVPKFTDLQLLQMIFGEINGLNGRQVITRGRELAQVIPMPTK